MHVMTSLREKRFINALQKKYKKKLFELVKKGGAQTLTVDGVSINLSWTPHLDELIDTCGGTTQALLDDCMTAVKEHIKVERRRKREAKKAYLKQNK